MGITTLSLAELRALPNDEKRRRLAAFVAARNQSPNGEAAFLAGRIADLEQRYEMSSARMQDLHSRNELRETADICTWLMLLEARTSLVEQAS